MIGVGDLPGIAAELIRQAARDNLSGLASELAYRFFLAVFPFFLFLASLGGLVASALGIDNPAKQALDLLGASLPSGAADVLRRELANVVEHQRPAVLSIGLLGTIVFATGGVNALIRTMNRAYDVEETRPVWKRYPIAAGLTVVLGLVTTAAFALFTAGQIVGQRVAASLGLEGTFWTVVSLGRWPLAIVLLVIGAGFLYWAAPNLDVKPLWVIPGALLFGIIWVVATDAFGYYVSHVGSYGATYGALGGIVIVLIWFYLSAFALLLGAELNQIIDQRLDPEGLADRRRRRSADAEAQPRG